MKDATIKKHAKNSSAIQSIEQVDSVSGLFKFEAEVFCSFKGVEKEWKVSTWQESEEEAKKVLTKMMVDESFRLIKRYYND